MVSGLPLWSLKGTHRSAQSADWIPSKFLQFFFPALFITVWTNWNPLLGAKLEQSVGTPMQKPNPKIRPSRPV